MSLKDVKDSDEIQRIGNGNTDNYEMICRVGSGRYGDVFEAFNVTNNQKVAIKVLKPVRPEKVIREISLLKQLNGGPNIIRLKDVVINSGIPSLIFPFISKDTLRNLGPNLNRFEIHFYLLKLLHAIDYTHRHNIIHRDIKPSNIVIDRNRKRLRLIDWGLADTYTEGKLYSVSVASRHYKSPELLCNYSKYDYSLDMWSFGCIVAGLIFRREPFFQGNDNLDQLLKITYVLGTNCLKEYVKKYNMNKSSIKSVLDSNYPTMSWKQWIESDSDLTDEMAIDFVDKLLLFDHKYRLTSNEALSHPFFEGFDLNKL